MFVSKGYRKSKESELISPIDLIVIEVIQQLILVVTLVGGLALVTAVLQSTLL